MLTTIRRVAREEDGAAYTLSYVMTIPVYAVLICLMIESCLMLVAKLGTVYAGYSAARSAAVWSSATTWEKVQKKAEQAALQSFVPFASGTQTAAIAGGLTTDAIPYGLAYRKYAKNPVNEKYLLAKYGYARRAMKVTIEGPPTSWDADIKVKIEYQFPFNVPGIGMLLGQRSWTGGYTYNITSVVALQNEGPQNDTKSLGIGYGILE